MSTIQSNFAIVEIMLMELIKLHNVLLILPCCHLAITYFNILLKYCIFAPLYHIPENISGKEHGFCNTGFIQRVILRWSIPQEVKWSWFVLLNKTRENSVPCRHGFCLMYRPSLWNLGLKVDLCTWREVAGSSVKWLLIVLREMNVYLTPNSNNRIGNIF